MPKTLPRLTMAASCAETGAASGDIVLLFLVAFSGRPLKIKTRPHRSCKTSYVRHFIRDTGFEFVFKFSLGNENEL